MVNCFHRKLDLLNIRMQNRSKDLPLADPPIRHFHTLDGIQLHPHQFSQSLLELRISVISKSGCKSHHRRFTDTNFFPHLCSRQKSRFIIILTDKIRQFFLSFAEFLISFIDHLQQFIFYAHAMYLFFKQWFYYIALLGNSQSDVGCVGTGDAEVWVDRRLWTGRRCNKESLGKIRHRIHSARNLMISHLRYSFKLCL